jgi:hypothetical protein
MVKVVMEAKMKGRGWECQFLIRTKEERSEDRVLEGIHV